MSAAAMLLLLQAAAPTPAPDRLDETIVVVGRSPGSTAAALQDCIARRCPPKQDIALSIAHAQAQFEAGDYQGSRKTLLAARRRDKGYAAELPLDVADLHRATARMSGLNGLRDEARSYVFDIVDSLKAGLGKRDEQVMFARLEVGAMFARSGRMKAALDQYMSVAKAAHHDGLSMVEGAALFQRAALLATAAAASRGYAAEARQAALAVTGRDEPAWLPFRNALRIVPALLAPADQRATLMDAAIRAMEPQPGNTPQLLYAPAVDLADSGSPVGEQTEWMDIGYRVAADGTVHDVQLLRRSDRVRDAWVTAATKALNGRRYAPMLLREGQSEPHRTERISFVSDLIIDWASKGSTRAPERRADTQELSKGIETR